MSSTFSFSRLGKLIAKQLFENSRLYIFSTLALIGLMAIVFGFWISVSGPQYNEEETYIFFLVGLFITGTIFASMSFNMLGNKDKGLYWLSVPATHLEKLVCTILYSIILFTLVYTLCFFIVKGISISMLKTYISDHRDLSYREFDKSNPGFIMAAKYMACTYFAVQSLYLLGSVYFRRYAFIITTVAGSALIFFIAYYISEIADTMKGDWELISLRRFDAGDEDGYKLYSISPVIRDTMKYIFQLAWAPLFWVVTWFRLKEKEI